MVFKFSLYIRYVCLLLNVIGHLVRTMFGHYRRLWFGSPGFVWRLSKLLTWICGQYRSFCLFAVTFVSLLICPYFCLFVNELLRRKQFVNLNDIMDRLFSSLVLLTFFFLEKKNEIAFSWKTLLKNDFRQKK